MKSTPCANRITVHSKVERVHTKFLTLVETFEGVLVELEGSTAIV